MLPRLLSRVIDIGRRAIVLTAAPEHLAALDQGLWTFDESSFLPHGRAPDPNAAHQPIWLTDRMEVPNGADILVLVEGAEAPDAGLAGFSRCLDIFDGLDERALAAARARWSRFKAAGHAMSYWQQTAGGRWEKKA